MRVLLILFICVTNAAASGEPCELTDEYKSVRNEVAKMVFGTDNDFNRCKEAANSNAYWIALSTCVKNGEGKNVGGGCAHLVSYGKYFSAPDVSHCNALDIKPSKEIAQNLVDTLANDRDIQKCK